MSFDPFGQDPQAQPPQPTPGPGTPPSAPAPMPGMATTSERVMMPAIFLIGTGVLNLLAALGMMGFGFMTTRLPAKQLEEQLAKQQPENFEQMKKAGWTIEDVMKVYLYGGVGGGAVVLLAALLSILGGVCMVMLRGYGIAVLASVVTAVPCISPMSCPCLFGLMLGIWSLTVLLNADVRASFR